MVARVPQICKVCKGFKQGGGVCARCAETSAGCPVCGDGTRYEVCQACVNEHVPHCDLCFGPLGENEGRPCKKCVAAKGGLPTPDKFAVNDAPIGTGVEGHYRYEPAGAGATLPAPSFEIPR